MTRTILFRTDAIQTVRLPEEVALPPEVRTVVVLRDGPCRIIVPAEACWDDFFDSPGVEFSERDQPAPQVRDLL